MSQRTDKDKLLALQTAYRRELSQTSIRQRWGFNDWDLLFPWWRQPAKVRILMYADGLVLFSGGIFGGLQHVITLLQSRLIRQVDFEVTTAHRDGAAGPPLKLTDLDIVKNFDEIWFFGFKADPNLTQAEIDVLDDFMKQSGGVLVTGDHRNLGKGIAGQITRAGEMRQYPAPDSGQRESNTTLEEGPDENSVFNEFDQSDDLPQTIRYIRFPVATPLGFKQLSSPHPLLCGPDGPLEVFPDHGHEGEAVAPEITEANTQWPTKNGHQEKPYVIAKGLIKDPCAIKHGQEIGLVSAYDGHTVDVGRIVADSSWHHWFDINLLGAFPDPPYAGFDATPRGRITLKKIESYFLNCAVWLAPPTRQAEMRNAAWWSILWTDNIAELSTDAPLRYLGEQAINSLSLQASSCAAINWILDSPAFKEEIPRREWSQLAKQFQLFNLPFEQYVAGGIIRRLLLNLGPADPNRGFPTEALPDEVLEEQINAGVKEGLSALKSQLTAEALVLFNLVNNNFQ